MTARVGIRDLRNNTRAVIEQARQVGEVVITSNGTDVAVLSALPSDWDSLVDVVVADAPPPFDTGLTALLSADDANSVADLG